ncbi:ATPase domain-containing protein [Polyangium mundeleinium]|uniref:non-specific serine/threonine protein kinase n=1 Tax=Polyangium mundeleinium TaxID=2995306 RepID=A0ABT5EWU4_9BACT|nr:ATPase domain-containing protein [Polyangium mundeleinium]MDC0746266.1 ATPase domain-containing protein [Polyangium mundeleinium]
MKQDDAERPSLDRIPTGITGLDTVLGGGFLAGSVHLVVGPPGSGKTILANQITFRRAATGQTAVYVTLLAEAHARMLAHLAAFEFFDPTFVPHRIVYMSGYGVLEQSGLDGLLELLGRTIREHGAMFLVLDGLGTAEEFAPTTSVFKRFLLTLSTSASLTGCTMLLLATQRASDMPRPEQATVDGLITLDKRRIGARSERELVVEKMRATKYALGAHAIDIDEKGIHVYPRLEAWPFQPPSSAPPRGRIGFGVPGLDTMLGGGVLAGSSTVLVGAPGTGKTLLGMSFLLEGVRRGERGIYLGFGEGPARIVQAARAIGLDAQGALDRSELTMLWYPPTEGTADAVAWRLLEEASEEGQKRVFIDELRGFRNMVTDVERLDRFHAALWAELARRGATTLLAETISTWERAPSTSSLPQAAFVDNVIVLEEEEKGRRLRRYVATRKVAGGKHDPSSRRLRISSHGIEVERPNARGRLRGSA